MKKQTVSKNEMARKASKKSVKEPGNAGIKKQYLKSGLTCKVSFKLPKEVAPEAHSVTVVGDFNNWDNEATPMKRLKRKAGRSWRATCGWHTSAD